MAKLSTHVLDTARGLPAEGVVIELRSDDGGLLSNVVTNRDGRTDQPLLSATELPIGSYELIFHAGDYLRRVGLTTDRPHFLETVPVRFHIADPFGNYHVPLLLSPFAYSTYRGS